MNDNTTCNTFSITTSGNGTYTTDYTIALGDYTVYPSGARNAAYINKAMELLYEYNNQVEKPNNYVTFKNGSVYSSNSNDYFRKYIMPDVEKVKVINNKIVVLFFADGSKEKAVLSDGDSFSLEEGITICILKKMLSDCTKDNGTAIYNKIVKHVVKKYNDQIKADKDKKEKEEAEKRKEEKFIAKKKAREERKKAAERKEKVDIIRDALLEYYKCRNNQDE